MTTLLPETRPAVTTREVSEEVARGVALLDEKRPGWEHEIDLDRLDVGDPCRCVLGQLYGGSFIAGCVALDLGEYEEDDNNSAFAAEPDHYPALTAEWRHVIETLRTERAAT